MRAVPVRVFAIDWSGDKRKASKKIWLAEVKDARLLRVENGRTPEEVVHLLIDECQKDQNFIVGFDFAFSFPESFCRRLRPKHVYDIWDEVSSKGERWLSECDAPFWGKAGRKRCASETAYRKTELAVACIGLGLRPKSIFQIGGAGAVGTGSIRGIPLLTRLHKANFSIWPFDPPGWPLVVEIYPRLLTGPVNKSSLENRAVYLTREFPRMSRNHYEVAVSCEDAFDATVSALVMDRRAEEFRTLSQAITDSELIEGRIWY
jgi:hypothetical protein